MKRRCFTPSFFLDIKLMENPDVIPRRTLTDADRRRMYIYHEENPTASKQGLEVVGFTPSFSSSPSDSRIHWPAADERLITCMTW